MELEDLQDASVEDIQQLPLEQIKRLRFLAGRKGGRELTDRVCEACRRKEAEGRPDLLTPLLQDLDSQRVYERFLYLLNTKDREGLPPGRSILDCYDRLREAMAADIWGRKLVKPAELRQIRRALQDFQRNVASTPGSLTLSLRFAQNLHPTTQQASTP